MRIGFLSDIHANLPALRAVLADVEEQGIEAVASCGDILGYGAWPVETLECLQQVPGIEERAVLGNHDVMALGMPPDIAEGPARLEHPGPRWFGRDLPTRLGGARAEDTARVLEGHRQALDSRPDLLEWLAGLPIGRRAVATRLTVCHGGHWEPPPRPLETYVLDNFAATREYRAKPFEGALVLGHSHLSAMWSARPRGPWWEVTLRFSRDRTRRSEVMRSLPEVPAIVNPGSVGQPRTGDPRAAWAWVCTERCEIHFVRVPYDVEGTRLAMLQRGSPRYFADRLLDGR